MKAIRYKLHALSSAHVLFYSYRWGAWILAGLAIAFARAPTQQALNAWLLVLTAVLNIAITSLARSYMPIARRRPLILALDVVASVALVWASGGDILPFLPYALGALILPSVLMGWRGALTASVVFVILDYVALRTMNMEPGRSIYLATPGLRAVVPLMFALVCATIPWLAQRIVMLPGVFLSHKPEHPSISEHERIEPEPNTGTFQSFAAIRRQAEPKPEQRTPDTTIAAQLTTVRATTEHSNHKPSHTIYNVAPNLEIEFSIALNQLVAHFSEQSNVDVHMVMIGSMRKLSPVQYSTLFKLAQEALLNIQQHAHAHSAVLTLQYAPHAVTLTVQDDGVGLLDGTHERPGVHALRAVHYRLAELDGDLQVFEGENGGVTVRGRLPFGDN